MGAKRLRSRGVQVEPLELRRLLAASISVQSEFGGNIVDGDTTPSQNEGTDFGTSFVADSRPFRTYQITNTSAADDLQLSNLTVPAGFKIEKNLPDLLGPGSSSFFTISMLDTAQQTNSGAVQFTTNVSGSQTFDFAVTGTLAPAAPSVDNIFEDVPSFSDQDTLLKSQGTDPDGLPVSTVQNRLLRFNVPAGQADVKFTLSTTLSLDIGATGDGELLVLRDANHNNLLDLSELAQPVTSFVPPTGAGPTDKTVVLTADKYFVLLRVANFATENPPADPPNVRIDYSLQTAITAIQPADITVTFGDAIISDGSSTTSTADGTDFGAAQVGQAAVQRTFTVTNIGEAVLQLGSVGATGDFTIVSGLPATLDAGSSANLVVQMSTATAGNKSGAVSFSTNVDLKNPYNFALTGTVSSIAVPVGDIAVSLQGGAALTDGQTQAIDFGSVSQGQAGPTRTFVVTNSGTGTLTLGAVTVPAGFELTEALAVSLAPGASDTFTVTLLSSGTPGPYSGSVSIGSDDPDESPFDFPVTGAVAGSAPEINVSLEGGGSLSDNQAATIDFGSVAQGAAGTTRRFIVQNTGTAALTLGPVTVPSGFVISEPLIATLGPGEQGGFTVTLGTTTAGERNGSISIASNDADENPFIFPVHAAVTGVGSTPGADITILLDGNSIPSGGSIDFGNAPVGGTGPDRTITIRNDGTSALSLGQVTLPAGFTLVKGASASSLAPGESDTIRVAVDTSLAGARSGEATIVSNDADENPFVLNLTGTVGVAASVAPFTIGPVTAKVPAVVIAGTKQAKALVSFKVINTSSTVAFSGPVTFTVLASSDNVADGSDATLVTVTRTVKLKAGRSKTLKLKAVFASSVAEGSKTLLVTATTTTGADTSAVGPAVTVQAPFVHLTGSSTPQTPAAKPLAFDRAARFTVPLTNGGNVPTTKTPATYSLIVSTDGTPQTSVFSSAALGKISVKPGATKAQKFSVTFPAGSFAPGSYTLIVRITAELNGTNGQTVALIPLTIG